MNMKQVCDSRTKKIEFMKFLESKFFKKLLFC